MFPIMQVRKVRPLYHQSVTFFPLSISVSYPPLLWSASLLSVSACCSKKCCCRSCRGRVTCCLCLVCYSKFFRRSVTGDTRSTISTGSGDGSEGAGSAAGAGGDGTVSTGSKPRSLRFTWSMKTTSSMEPAEMMKEIRKVSFLELSFHSYTLFITQIVTVAAGCSVCGILLCSTQHLSRA